MNISEIQECLEPWMKVGTWHTSHSLDEKRFHKALQDCFQRVGQPIDFDSFKDAMHDLAERLPPQLESEYLEQVIEGYARNAEVISSYLSDVDGGNSIQGRSHE